MRIIVLFILMFTSVLSYGQSEQKRKKHFNIKREIAIGGYDPVSYYKEQPQPGNKEFQFRFNGITYLFSGKENLILFKDNPQKYEPAYGGWCAYAMGVSGDKVKINPETYKITEGKLFLFYNFKGNNTLSGWNKYESNLTKKADEYWLNLLK